MHWLPPEIVLRGIEWARSIRFGEPGNLLPEKLTPKLALVATAQVDDSPF
jgi:hypothetical protein